MTSLHHNGIEIIARGIITDGVRILLNAPNQNPVPYYYLPGGHVEFGETGEECLQRECLEETGETISSVHYLTTIENFFTDYNGEHHEINLIYAAEIQNTKFLDIVSKESHIVFKAVELSKLHDIRLVPSQIAKFVLHYLNNGGYRNIGQR